MAIGPAIGAAAGNVIGSAIGSLGKGPKRQYKYWKKQFAHQAAYNHPTQQMARLEAAGLNPNLVYGQGVSGASGETTRGGDIDFGQTSGTGLGQGVSGAIGTYFNTRNAQLKIEEQAIQNSLLGIERSVQGEKAYIEREIMQNQYDYKASRVKHGPLRVAQFETDEFRHQADARRMSAGLIKQRYLSNQIDLRIKDQTKNDVVKQIANNAMMALHGAGIREQEKIMKQAEARLYKHIPRDAVTNVLNVLRFLFLKR